MATRPTTDRVREALFSMLASMHGLSGARVLDLWAGSGALALEALSRGAAEATLVESGREALAAIRANVASLGLDDRARVVPAQVERATKQLHNASFELVFADPPWADVDTGAAVRAIAALLGPTGALLAEGGILVLEHASKTASPALAPLVLERTRAYGDTSLSLYTAYAAYAAYTHGPTDS
jgi:16S rRNA (guanine966-N2)-methyltransferase